MKEQKWEYQKNNQKKLLRDASAFIELQKIFIQSCLEICKFKDAIDHIKDKVSSNVKSRDEEFNNLLTKAYYFKGDYDLAKKEISNLIKQGIVDEKISKLK